MYDNFHYLREGNPLQQSAYQVLQELNIVQKLVPFTPMLCGTIPLNIQTRQSDLDLICEVKNFNHFEALLRQHYSDQPGFNLSRFSTTNQSALTASFKTSHFPVEIFGQNCPVRKQHAYRHMVQEGRVLALADAHFRQQIIHLKESGLSTEAAFAWLLELPGDPYEAVLSLEEMTDENILEFLNQGTQST